MKALTIFNDYVSLKQVIGKQAHTGHERPVYNTTLVKIDQLIRVRHFGTHVAVMCLNRKVARAVLHEQILSSKRKMPDLQFRVE